MVDIIVSKFEDDEDEFRSCCSDEEALEQIVELESKNGDYELDEHSVRMFFKGVSVSEPRNKLEVSGIGVIMEGPNKVPSIQIQKRLEFFVVEEVVEYLALVDGLSEAIQNNIKRVYAFTNSQNLFDQITNDSTLDNPLLMALKQRIPEHVINFEHFVLKHAHDVNLEYPLHLAKAAIGIAHDAKVRCPSSKCGYDISTLECNLFLPVALLEDRRWRQCGMCERMIEEMDGCYRMRCWCGHEFCACAIRGEEEDKEEEENDENTLTPTTPSDPSRQLEEWAWESFGSLSNMMDAYSDEERSQLALIQRFLAGGFSLGDHQTNSHDDGGSFLDNTIKDLHQLPWLERFVSAISDNYYNEYTR